MIDATKALFNWFIFLFLILLVLPTTVLAASNENEIPPDNESVADVNEQISGQIDVLDSLHEGDVRYQFTNLQSLDGSSSGSLQLLQSSASIVVLPKIHIGADLPIFVAGGGPAGSGVFVGNPKLKIRSKVFSNLQREFPHFIYFNGWLQFPRKGGSVILVDRTDIGVSTNIRKAFYRFILNSELGFVSRIDPKNSKTKYGDMLFGGIGAEYYFPKLPLAVETSFLWRNAWSANINGNVLPTQSVLTSSTNLKLEPWLGIWFESGIDIPINSGPLGEIAALFGDYEASGLWGTTFWMNFKYQF